MKLLNRIFVVTDLQLHIQMFFRIYRDKDKVVQWKCLYFHICLFFSQYLKNMHPAKTSFLLSQIIIFSINSNLLRRTKPDSLLPSPKQVRKLLSTVLVLMIGNLTSLLITTSQIQKGTTENQSQQLTEKE